MGLGWIPLKSVVAGAMALQDRAGLYRKSLNSLPVSSYAIDMISIPTGVVGAQPFVGGSPYTFP